MTVGSYAACMATDEREPSPDVALYGHWICPFSTRVEFALYQRGIRYELVDLPPSAVRGRDVRLPPEFVEHSPRLEIPMVRVGAEYLADSIPILELLELRFADDPLLPADPGARSVVRERMAWIDRCVFGPMVGVYYGTDPGRRAQAGERLAAALDEMSCWTEASGWLAGAGPTLAEAVVIPVYVRMEGLRGLGFTASVSRSVEAHAERCRSLTGWSAIAWSADQTGEFVGRFEAFRRRHA